jgi:alanine racemase
MDLIMVDVSNIKGLKVLDEVILIGKDKNQVIKAPEIAKLAQTIPDEIVSRLGKRVPKVYLD